MTVLILPHKLPGWAWLIGEDSDYGHIWLEKPCRITAERNHWRVGVKDSSKVTSIFLFPDAIRRA